MGFGWRSFDGVFQDVDSKLEFASLNFGKSLSKSINVRHTFEINEAESFPPTIALLSNEDIAYSSILLQQFPKVIVVKIFREGSEEKAG